MKFFKIKTVLLFIFLFTPLLIHGRSLDYRPSVTSPVDISAMFVEYNREKNIYIAKGSVDLKEGTRVLNADYVFFDENTQEIFAEGNVVFQDEGDRVECEKLHMNLVTKKGKIETGKIYLQKGNFHVTGEEISKIGDAQYSIKKGEFTTCGWENPAWKFTASDVDITIEGYAKTKGAKFHIADFPVFYFPWGIFPVKTERQSGFLMPEFAVSTRDGMVLNLSYFWAISKDKDATFFLDYIENRGLKPAVEFRYAPTEDMKGVWDYAFISDRKYDNTRWQLRGQHEQLFKNNMTMKSDLKLVSDKDYLVDFGMNAAERSESMLKSTAYLETPMQKSLLTTELAYFQTLASKDNDPIFKYYPHTTFFTEYIPFLDGKLYTDFTTDFTSFYREKGDKVARLGVEPKVRLPYAWNGINFLISGTLIETAYLVNHADGGSSNDNEYRQTFRIEGDASTQFMRYYQTDFLKIGEMNSVIKPVVKYNFIPNTSFTSLPNIDPYDRLYQTNTITYSLNHYLNPTSGAWNRELSLFEVSQTYGLSGGLRPSALYKGSGGRFSDIDAKLTVFPTNNLSYTNESIISTGGDGLKTIRNGFNYNRPDVYHVNLSHNYTQDLNNEVFLDLGGAYQYFKGMYQVRYSFQDGAWIDTLYSLRYNPGCWATTLTLTQTKRPRDTSIKISFDLSGITMK